MVLFGIKLIPRYGAKDNTMTMQFSLDLFTNTALVPQTLVESDFDKWDAKRAVSHYDRMDLKFSRIALCENVVNGWESKPLVVGLSTYHVTITNLNHERLNEVAKMFEVVEVNGNNVLTIITHDNRRCVAHAIHLADLQVMCEQAELSANGIADRVYSYRGLIKHSYIAYDFLDLFDERQRDVQVICNHFTKTGYYLTSDLLTEVKQRIVTTDYRFELSKDKNDTIVLTLKYEFIIGGFGIAAIKRSSIPEKVLAMIEGRTSDRKLQLVSDKPCADKTSSLDDDLAKLVVVNERRIELPKETLTHYAKIRAMMLEADAKYAKGGFNFKADRNASEVLDLMLTGQNVKARHKEFAYFGTKACEAVKVVSAIDTANAKRVFEPHAGEGAIADAVRKLGIEPITNELWETNHKVLMDKSYKPTRLDFLTMTPDDIGGKVCAVVGNPPWGKLSEITHFMHALTFLNDGGTISMIVSPSVKTSTTKKAVAFRNLLALHNAEERVLPMGSFDHTTVGGLHITIKNYHPK
jgi:predicted RNA methylase